MNRTVYGAVSFAFLIGTIAIVIGAASIKTQTSSAAESCPTGIPPISSQLEATYLNRAQLLGPVVGDIDPVPDPESVLTSRKRGEQGQDVQMELKLVRFCVEAGSTIEPANNGAADWWGAYIVTVEEGSIVVDVIGVEPFMHCELGDATPTPIDGDCSHAAASTMASVPYELTEGESIGFERTDLRIANPGPDPAIILAVGYFDPGGPGCTAKCM